MFRKQQQKIDFIGVGAQKCGTTALHFFLNQHPDIGLPKKVKELHFFDKDDFIGSKKEYSSYHNNFDFKLDKKCFGEITPIYCFWDNSLQRIWEYNSEIKIIFILRNPISRAFSHWNMETQRGLEMRSFGDSIREERSYCFRSLPLQDRVASYIARGMYVDQIRKARSFFREDQLLFIKYEDFRANQEAHLDKVFKFLEVDSSKFIYEKEEIHSRKYDKAMDNLDRIYLAELYKYEILEIEKSLGWDCSDWK